MKIGVLGAGNAGQAFAGGLTLKGHEIHLAALPGHDTQIRILQTFGGVAVEGVTAHGIPGGFAKIARVDTDVGAAAKECELLLLVVPAFAQDAYFEIIANQAPDGQMVVIQPGKFGALRLAQCLRDAGRAGDALLIAETSTFLLAAKISALDHVWLRGVKKTLPLAALPSTNASHMIERLKSVHEQYVAAPNVLATSMDDAAYSLHPVSTLLNLARLETMGPYRTHCYDITPQTARMVEAVDNDRCNVARAFGVDASPIAAQLEAMYGLSDGNLYERLSQSTVHRNQKTPSGAQHRYVSEEVPYGLVPLAEFGKLAGVATPAIDSIITLASVVNDTDYRTKGRHVGSLGLHAASPDKIGKLL